MERRSPAMPRFFAAFSIVLTLTLTPSGYALAGAAPSMAPPIPLPSVQVDGPAQIDERRVQVRCREVDGATVFTCDVEVRFRLTTCTAKARARTASSSPGARSPSQVSSRPT